GRFNRVITSGEEALFSGRRLPARHPRNRAAGEDLPRSVIERSALGGEAARRARATRDARAPSRARAVSRYPHGGARAASRYQPLRLKNIAGSVRAMIVRSFVTLLLRRYSRS